VDAVWLPSRHGIGALVAAVDAIRVVVAGLCAGDRRGEDAVPVARDPNRYATAIPASRKTWASSPSPAALIRRV